MNTPITRTVTTMQDIFCIIDDFCGSDEPARTENEMRDYFNSSEIEWEFGEDIHDPESGIRQIIDEMFDTGWIWG